MGMFLQKYSYMNVLLIKYSILYLGQMNCFQWDKENPSKLAQVRKKANVEGSRYTSFLFLL